LFHGDPDHADPDFVVNDRSPNILREIMAKSVESRSCAVLIVSTEVIEPPQDCSSPYIHFYSVSVPNRKPNSFEHLFQALVNKFVQLSAMPDESAMLKMWSEVDPDENRIALLQMLTKVLRAPKGKEAQAFTEYQQTLQVHFGPNITYAQLREKYLELSEQYSLKKN
jgi:hypothetical protein